MNRDSARRRTYASLLTSRRQREGFSLMELLTVMVIISLISTISVQSLAPLMSSNHVNEATSIVQGQLELAQQTAKTLNRSVQLRFYRNQKNSSATPSIDTLQIVVPAENSAIESDQTVEKPVPLPQGVIVADGASDLLLKQFSGTGPSFAAFNPAPPAFYTSCYILTFSPTGAITSTDTSNVPIAPSTGYTSVYWSVSLVPQIQYRAKGNSVANLKNYATFYLNSVNGTFSCARP